jgi:hypothetical protein
MYTGPKANGMEDEQCVKIDMRKMPVGVCVCVCVCVCRYVHIFAKDRLNKMYLCAALDCIRLESAGHTFFR